MTIDEIFAALPEEVAQDVHEYLVIDPVTRTIQVPAAESIFGVEADTGTERKYFICPRYVGDKLDLAACFLSIKYRNANGEKDEYLVEDTAVNGEYVTFSWLLSSKVVAYKGVVQFRFYADTGAGKDWGTTLAQGESLEGMETDDTTVEAETSDVVAQLRAMVTQQTGNVEAVGAAQVQNVKTEGSTQVAAVKATGDATEAAALAAIEAKGEAVRASIPAEYTDLAAQVDKLTRDRAAAIVCQAEGELLQIADAGNDPLQGLRIFGRTEQWKTTGKNLLDVSEENALYLAGYKNYTVTDGVVTITGESFFGFKMPVTYGAGYTVSLKKRATESTCHFRVYEYSSEPSAMTSDAPGFIGNPINDSCAGMTSVVKNYTPTAAAVTWVVIGFYTTQTNVVTEFMAELGTEATAYEPYSGGVAAPCPDWPMELQNVPAPVVSVWGKNLMDWDRVLTALTTSPANLTMETGDRRVALSGTPTANFWQCNNKSTEIPAAWRGRTMYLSATLAGTEPYLVMYIKDANNNNLPSASLSATGVYEFVMPENAAYYLFAFCLNKKTTGATMTAEYSNLHLGLTAEGGEAYKQAQELTVTTPGSLPGIPVTSGGNYTDANGQQWICDEVDLARGVYVQRTGTRVLTGSDSEHWGAYNPAGGEKVFHCYLVMSNYARRWPTTLCDRFRNVASVWEVQEYGLFSDYNTSDLLYFSAPNAEVTDMDTWKAWLQANPVTIVYLLAEPVETALTDVEIQAYLALHSNKPTTTVLNDAGAHMVLEYAADPKTYIDNKLAALIAANN